MRRLRRPPPPFDIINRRIYTKNRCFFCGKLMRNARSREHVFPRWLQKKFQLENQKLTLLNGTTIPYRRLTVPCCARCNNVHLSQLESQVKSLLFDRPLSEARQHLDKFFIWVTKIFLGIVYAERMLPLRQRHPRGKPILPLELRDQFRMTHFFVQSLVTPMKFRYMDQIRIPGSVFLFDLKSSQNLSEQFDFRHSMFDLAISIRLGNRGILAVADGGTLDFEIGDLLRRDGRRRLHPIQFAELGAKTFYKARLLNRTPTYLMVNVQNELQVEQLPLAGVSPRPIFDDWKQSDYAQVLAIFTGYPLEQLVSADGTKVTQWFTDPNGKPLNIRLKSRKTASSIPPASPG
jgi:hypothetical protein